MSSNNNIITSVVMAAAYALGIASPKEFHYYPKECIAKTTENYTIIKEKIEQWNRYGNIVAIRFLMNDWDNIQKANYIWMITDQHAVIIATIKKPSSARRPVNSLNTKWNFEGGISLINGSDYTSNMFIKAAPNTLVIDDSIEELSFVNYEKTSWRYAPIVSFDQVYYCKSLRWVKKLIIPSKTIFIPEDFDYVCTYAYKKLKAEREDFWTDYDSFKDLPLDLFDKDVELLFSDNYGLPYYIKDNIIFRASDNSEAYCLNTDIRRKRYNRMFERGVEAVQNSWKEHGLCQYCGGAFSGILIKKCCDCNKKMDYTPHRNTAEKIAMEKVEETGDSSFDNIINELQKNGFRIPDFLKI